MDELDHLMIIGPQMNRGYESRTPFQESNRSRSGAANHHSMKLDRCPRCIPELGRCLGRCGRELLDNVNR